MLINIVSKQTENENITKHFVKNTNATVCLLKESMTNLENYVAFSTIDKDTIKNETANFLEENLKSNKNKKLLIFQYFNFSYK